MTEHLRLIARQLNQLQHMRQYLVHFFDRCSEIFPVTNWQVMSMDQHEMLAAFRVRFSEFQEHLGKTMRAVAIEEEVNAERFGSVLAFMEKLGVLESVERWKMIREIRNSVNHEYEEDGGRLTQFFSEMFKATPELLVCHDKLVAFCAEAYRLGSSPVYGR
jgi:hypothetical protein